jgi:hypothetical protein
MTVDEILINNGLDFTIEKLPLYADTGVSMVKSPYYGLLNTKSGNVINTVKEGYTVSQNRDLVELVLKGIESFNGDVTVQKGGSINDGRKIYLQLKIEGYSKVGKDTIEKYITILDSNDSSSGLSIGIGDLTLSCSNQFYKFYKAADAKFMHSASLTQRILTIPSIIENALSESMKQIELYNKFQSTQISRDLASELVLNLLGFDKLHTPELTMEKSTRSLNSMEALYEHLEKEMNDKGDNLWGLHSGVTSYTTHSISVPRRDNGRIESLISGSGYNMNQKSLAFCKSIIL